MRRGTTLAHRFKVDVDLSTATVWVSYAQDGQIVLDKSGDELLVSEDAVVVPMSQEDTLKFKPGNARVQQRYVLDSGIAKASNMMFLRVDDVLKDGVISRG